MTSVLKWHFTTTTDPVEEGCLVINLRLNVICSVVYVDAINGTAYVINHGRGIKGYETLQNLRRCHYRFELEKSKDHSGKI